MTKFLGEGKSFALLEITTQANVRTVVQDTAHPFVGFFGAAVGYAAARRKEHLWAKTAFAAATLANFSAEIGQEVLLFSDVRTHFYDAPLETAKDYVFALVGVALFMARRRKRQ
jgi:hypothetical protein